ncbi:MAG: hypothetical protein JO097_03445 [Acidobacteriaceae bacterium]|nr:hypothetical protein [Acidobacteriaceae bacterium]
MNALKPEIATIGPSGSPTEPYGIVRHSTLWLKPILVGQFDLLSGRRTITYGIRSS